MNREPKFKPGDVVAKVVYRYAPGPAGSQGSTTRRENRYGIVHLCRERSVNGTPRYVATLLGDKPRNVVILETGMEAAE